MDDSAFSNMLYRQHPSDRSKFLALNLVQNSNFYANFLVKQSPEELLLSSNVKSHEELVYIASCLLR